MPMETIEFKLDLWDETLVDAWIGHKVKRHGETIGTIISGRYDNGYGIFKAEIYGKLEENEKVLKASIGDNMKDVSIDEARAMGIVSSTPDEPKPKVEVKPHLVPVDELPKTKRKAKK